MHERRILNQSKTVFFVICGEYGENRFFTAKYRKNSPFYLHSSHKDAAIFIFFLCLALLVARKQQSESLIECETWLHVSEQMSTKRKLCLQKQLRMIGHVIVKITIVVNSTSLINYWRMYTHVAKETVSAKLAPYFTKKYSVLKDIESSNWRQQHYNKNHRFIQLEKNRDKRGDKFFLTYGKTYG